MKNVKAVAAAGHWITTERVVELATRICAARPDDGTEGPIAEIVAEVLEQAGAQVHVQEVVAGRPNVIAKVPGGPKPPLVLNGHLDAGIHEGGWTREPNNPWINGDRIVAGGVTDMLGAVASMVAAVEAAARMDSLPRDLILHAVMHHDTIGLGAKYLLDIEGPYEGYGICGEPSNLTIQTANGGAIKFEVTYRGKTAHISRAEAGVDTLPSAVRFYDAVRQTIFDHEYSDRLPQLPRVLVGEFNGGLGSGAIADQTVVRGDVRTVPGMTRQQVQKRIGELVTATCDPEVATRVRIIAVQRPFLGVQDGPLVSTLAQVHEVVRGRPAHVGVNLPMASFVTDAADMANHGLDTVVYGPCDWHVVPDETASITDLVDAARIYLATALALNGEGQ